MGQSIDAYEQLEAACIEFKDLPIAKDRIKELKKMGTDKAIKKELRARSAYLKIQAGLKSQKTKNQAAARKGAQQLAEIMGDTKYGAMAAQL